MKSTLTSLAVSILLFGVAGGLYAIDLLGQAWSQPKLTLTFFVLACTHFLFRVVIYAVVVQRVTSRRMRYSLSKVLTLIHLSVATMFVLRVWLPDSTALLAAYGFVAAAVAFSVQDLFKNFIGGIIILLRGLYRVGDRIQIGTTYGDIIDIGVLYTTLLEIRSWIDGDQSTGRIIRVPNGKVITTDIVNYTADHSFIWDELHIPITHESDWKSAEKIINEVVMTATSGFVESALADIRHLQTKYFLTTDNIEPRVYLKITDNWISLYARYIVMARDRRVVQDIIMRELKERFDKRKKITIASTTTTVTVVK